MSRNRSKKRGEEKEKDSDQVGAPQDKEAGCSEGRTNSPGKVGI